MVHTGLPFGIQCAILQTEMDHPEKVNPETIAIYLDGAREALESAGYNLDGEFYGVAVNRAYYAFFYALPPCS